MDDVQPSLAIDNHRVDWLMVAEVFGGIKSRLDVALPDIIVSRFDGRPVNLPTSPTFSVEVDVMQDSRSRGNKCYDRTWWRSTTKQRCSGHGCQKVKWDYYEFGPLCSVSVNEAFGSTAKEIALIRFSFNSSQL